MTSLAYKYIVTFSLFFCYFAYGVNFYVIGPTLIELASIFRTSLEQICLIYTIRSAGYTFGSLSGFLFKYINRQLALVFFVTLMGITLALIPHCTSINLVFVLAAINGFSIGSFDTAINVWMLEIWSEDSGPFMQALHFTYGIGAFVAPLICEPFLSTESVHLSHHHSPSSSSMEAANDTDPFQTLNISVIDPIDYLIHIPYAIAGAITIFSAMIVLGLFFYKKYEPPRKFKAPNDDQLSYQSKKKSSILQNGLEPPMPLRLTRSKNLHQTFMTVWIVLMGSMFFTLFVGMEQMHLQFLPTFAVNTDLNLSPSSAAMISSAAALAFTIGRCLSIPLAIKFRPQTILYTNHILMLIGTILLAAYANTSERMLWIGNIVLGCGFSSVYASIYAFLEQKISVTNRIGSIFVFAGGFTAAVSPSMVGRYIEADPLILIWFDLICCLLCLTVFFIIHLTLFLDGKQTTVTTKSFDTKKKSILADHFDTINLNLNATRSMSLFPSASSSPMALLSLQPSRKSLATISLTTETSSSSIISTTASTRTSTPISSKLSSPSMISKNLDMIDVESQPDRGTEKEQEQTELNV
ncbi:FAM76A protein [Sarcoptes scabiei]|nr:FAM76A protein [Sarcoptes scabiei]